MTMISKGTKIISAEVPEHVNASVFSVCTVILQDDDGKEYKAYMRKDEYDVLKLEYEILKWDLPYEVLEEYHDALVRTTQIEESINNAGPEI